MKICLIQTDPLARRANVQALGTIINQTGADLYVLPELFTTGFDYQAQHRPTEGEVIPDGPTCRQIQGFLRNRSSVVVCGLLEQSGNDFYNIAAVIGSGGVERYRQKHPASSTQGRVLRILPGDYRKIILPSLWGIGLMVCNDHYRADEFFAEYKMRNAGAVVLIADSSTRAWLKEFPDLCCQYGLPAIVCNAAGPKGGGSCVLNPAGKFIPLQASGREYDYLPDSVGAAVAVL